MKPVNLLPEEHRPSRPSGQRSGVAYPVLGTLAVVLVAVLAYVLTVNEVASKNDRAAAETQAAQAEAGALGPVANFLSIKQSREQSVRDLAGRRFDWERLTRELARVIPAGVYAKELTASVTGEDVAGAGNKAAAPAAAGAVAAASSPKLTMTGCAAGQRQVATLLVRLKQLHLVQDVSLAESKAIEQADQGTGTSSSVGAGTVESRCGDYEFKATVTFDPASVAMTETAGAQKPVPASLGGGK